uniref:DUF1279 domain-containing protein n=1 Tax=Babesia bovis TaxID=5865 RepID=S6C9M6_BABBO|nr:hypothetical protein [Babesia bovis]
MYLSRILCHRPGGIFFPRFVAPKVHAYVLWNSTVLYNLGTTVRWHRWWRFRFIPKDGGSGVGNASTFVRDANSTQENKRPIPTTIRGTVAKVKKRFTRYWGSRKPQFILSTVQRYLYRKRLTYGPKRPSRHREKLRQLKTRAAEKSAALKISAIFALRKYGKLGAGIYLGVYIATLVLMNILTFEGYVSSDDLRNLLERINVTQFQVPDMDSWVAKFTVAYIATKVVKPLRLILSVLLVLAIKRGGKRG